jgi:hypothetical protein
MIMNGVVMIISRIETARVSCSHGHPIGAIGAPDVRGAKAMAHECVNADPTRWSVECESCRALPTQWVVTLYGMPGELQPQSDDSAKELCLTLLTAGYDVMLQGRRLRMYYGPGIDYVEYADAVEFPFDSPESW